MMESLLTVKIVVFNVALASQLLQIVLSAKEIGVQEPTPWQLQAALVLAVKIISFKI